MTFRTEQNAGFFIGSSSESDSKGLGLGLRNNPTVVKSILCVCVGGGAGSDQSPETHDGTNIISGKRVHFKDLEGIRATHCY